MEWGLRGMAFRSIRGTWQKKLGAGNDRWRPESPRIVEGQVQAPAGRAMSSGP